MKGLTMDDWFKQFGLINDIAQTASSASGVKTDSWFSRVGGLIGSILGMLG